MKDGYAIKRLCRVNRLVTGQIAHDTFTNLLDS